MSMVYRDQLRKQARNRKTNERKQRAKDLKNAVKWNLPRLEHDTIGVENVPREMVVKLLRLDKVNASADPTGNHCMQSLIAGGYLLRPKRRYGVEVFGRDDLVQSLRAYAGVC